MVETCVISGYEPRMAFRHFLAGIKCRRKLSHRQLAFRSGVDHSTLSRLARSDREASLEVFSRIVDSLELSDELTYALTLGGLPKGTGSGKRAVNNDSAPVLEGSLGQQLKGYMEQRGVSQRALEAKIKATFPDATLDHSAISRIISNERYPLLSSFALITYSLGLNPAQVRGLVRTAGNRPQLV